MPRSSASSKIKKQEREKRGWPSNPDLRTRVLGEEVEEEYDDFGELEQLKYDSPYAELYDDRRIDEFIKMYAEANAELFFADSDRLAAEQALAVGGSGASPLETLTNLYRNPLLGPRDRIAAAKAVLDFVHPKMPTRVKVSGGLKTFSPEDLATLSDDELKSLTGLLKKLGGEP